MTALSAEAAPPLDARLLPAAVACWAATCFGIIAGSSAALVLAGTLAVVGLACAIACGAAVSGRVAAVSAAAALLGSGFAVAVAARAHVAQTHPLATLHEGAHITATLVLTDDPQPLRTAFRGARQLLVRASLREFGYAGTVTVTDGRVVVLASADGWSALLPGQVVRVHAELARPQRRDLTVGALQVDGVPDLVAPPPWWQRCAGEIRRRFASSTQRALPPDAAGLLPAMVIGDTSRLPDRVREDFLAAGLSHLTAVSGANLSIGVGFVRRVTRRAGLGPRLSGALALSALVAFVVLARPSPSVLRAAAMGAIGVLALTTGRSGPALPALCASVVVLLAVAPALAVDIGFALSVVATAGLILLAPGLAARLSARGMPSMVAESIAVAVAAFVVTTPIVVVLLGRLSPISVVANVLVAPVVAPITVIGMVAVVSTVIWPPLGLPAEYLTCLPLWWLLRMAEWSAAVPGASIVVRAALPTLK